MTLPDPKHYWPFDEGSGTVATDTLGGAKITLQRASWSAGKWKTGLRFVSGSEGAGDVRTSLPDQPPPWTASMWVKREDKRSSSVLLCTEDNGYALKLEQWRDTGVLGITHLARRDLPLPPGSSAYSAALGTWVHLVFVGSATGTKVYANGQLQAAFEESIHLPLKWIGSKQAWDDFGAFVLDELKIFHEALSDEQVEELYKQTPAEPPPPPVVIKATLAFVHETSSTEGSRLYRLDLNTGKTTLVGPTVPDLVDIASLNNTVLLGLQMGPTPRVVRIDPRNGRSLVAGELTANVTGLGSYRGGVYAIGGTQFYKVDPDTGTTQSIGAWGAGAQGSAGDVAISEEGRAYTTIHGADGESRLASVNLQSGAVSEIGVIGAFNVTGMDFAEGNLFGVTDTGELLRIDTATGACTRVATTDPRGQWTGMACLVPPRRT